MKPHLPSLSPLLLSNKPGYPWEDLNKFIGLPWKHAPLSRDYSEELQFNVKKIRTRVSISNPWEILEASCGVYQLFRAPLASWWGASRNLPFWLLLPLFLSLPSLEEDFSYFHSNLLKCLRWSHFWAAYTFLECARAFNSVSVFTNPENLAIGGVDNCVNHLELFKLSLPLSFGLFLSLEKGECCSSFTPTALNRNVLLNSMAPRALSTKNTNKKPKPNPSKPCVCKLQGFYTEISCK